MLVTPTSATIVDVVRCDVTNIQGTKFTLKNHLIVFISLLNIFMQSLCVISSMKNLHFQTTSWKFLSDITRWTISYMNYRWQSLSDRSQHLVRIECKKRSQNSKSMPGNAKRNLQIVINQGSSQ